MIGITTRLSVSTLGRFEIRRDRSLLTGGNWSRRKVSDLFKILLAAEQHRLHREQIQEMLWPESTGEQAANSFGKTLYLLRRALEPALASGRGSASLYVLLEHDTLMLIPESFEIDADQFEAATKPLQTRMRNRSLQQPGKQQDPRDDALLLDEFDRVLNLYGGDFLPEDVYEDWAQRRRDRLRRIHSWLLENAAEVALANARGQQACEYLRALLERNSADEQTHRQLILLYARMGRRSDSLNQYQQLRHVLREELRAQPLPETTELFRSIQAGKIAADLVENIAQKGMINHAPAPPISNIEPEPATQSQIDPERILKAQLVGREQAIATIQRAFHQARNGQRKAVFICGEPGIGKTRLAQESTRRAEEEQGAITLWGYCYEMSGSLPYQPIADAISAYVRAASTQFSAAETQSSCESSVAALDKRTGELSRLLGDGAADLAKIAPEIRSRFPDLPQPEPIGPELERRNLYNAVAHFFQTLAAERPLIVVLDDLQWADAATMQLLNFLMIQSPPTQGQLFLMLYRADEVHETHPLRSLMTTSARNGISDDVRLQRLDEAQVLQLLVNIAGHSVRPVFAAEMYRQTEGNPFFIGEAIRSLILEGKLQWAGDHWQTTVDIEALEIPQSVRLLIERRLARLSPECRTTLALAAVLGRQFNSDLLCQARNLPEDVVAEHIDHAIQAQILSPPPSSTADAKPPFSPSDAQRSRESGVDGLAKRSSRESGVDGLDTIPLDIAHARTPSTSSRSPEHDPYGRDYDLAFTHDKIREVLYQWLNPLRRRTLHRQIAQAIELRHAAHLQAYYSALAHHYQLAENHIQAVDYLLKAAGHAASVYAFVDASTYMKTALDLLFGDEERPRRAMLLRQLSETYIYTGQLDKAVESGMASAALWRDLCEEVQQAEAYLHVAFCCHWQGRESEAVAHIQRALQCIEEKPEETALLAKVYTQWGLAATVMGDPLLAMEKLRQAEALLTTVETPDPFISVVSLWALSWCYYLTGSPAEMLAHALRGADVCCNSNKPEWEPMMNYSAAWAYMLLGRLDEGQEMARDAHRNASRHGVVGAQGWASLVQAFLAIQAGKWDEAAQYAQSAYAIATMLHDVDMQARVLWSRSVCSGWQGEWELAITESKKAMQLAQQDGELTMAFPYIVLQAAKSCYFAGKLQEAQSYLDQAMELAYSRHYRQLPAQGHRLQGRIWQAQNEFDKALPCFEHSLAELLALDDQVEYARTQEAFALFLLARHLPGDEELGHAHLKAARETFQRLGVTA